MKNYVVNVSAKTSKVYLDDPSIAVDGENIAGKIIFKFNGNEFIDGVARLEWQNGADKYFQLMEKVDKTYVLPIKNVMTKEGRMYFQLVITQAEVGDEIPVFKSNQFYVYVEKAINAEGEAPDEYATWLDTANAKIAEIDNLNITATKSGNTETITLTDKQGVEHTTYIYDGADGKDGANGKDAKINGVNTINIEAGDNITIDQVGNTLTINGQAGGGSGNVDDVKVNGTSVVENKVANIDLTGKQDLLVSGTNIKSINNNSLLGSGNLEVPIIYYPKYTEMFVAQPNQSVNTTINESDLAEYNALCLKANQFLPISMKNAPSSGYIDFYIFPRIRFSGKLQFMAYAYANNGDFFVSQSAEISNPVVGSLTTSDLTLTTYTKKYATKEYVDNLVGDIETLLGGI